MKTKFWAVLAAAGITLLAAFGLFDSLDRSLADRMFQEEQASDGDIVLVEINQETLDALGPFRDWERDLMARAIDIMNRSEDCRPAVIGIDILYTGKSMAGHDLALASAAERHGNVVLASAAEFTDGLRMGADGSFYLDSMFLSSYGEPYEELKSVTKQGHINAMYDADGILRHCLWELSLEDRTVPSFAAVVADTYRAALGDEEIIKPPTDRKGFWYLPYTGKPGDYSESLSLLDVIEGHVPAEYFADRIVLIGPYAAGLQDSYVTAIDHAAPMYGVEYQANAIEALLRGDYKREAGDGIQLLVLFAVLLACLAGFWKRPMTQSTALWLLVCAGYLGFCQWMYGRGLLLRVLWIPLGVTILYIGSIAVNYVWSVVEKRRITSTFKRYVAPEIVNEILEHGSENFLESGGKVVEIAVLFVDVRGFTSMSEALSPEEVVEILNRYLTLTARCIMGHGGTLDKFIGDAAMAFWGAPRPQEDFVMNAARTAVAMRQGSEALSKELTERFGRTVSFGIGIHVGEAVVGNIGSPERMDYTAIGDTVNTASRLESIAPGGTIYISREVAARLEGRIRTTPLTHKVHLKGKAGEQEILILEEILE